MLYAVAQSPGIFLFHLFLTFYFYCGQNYRCPSISYLNPCLWLVSILEQAVPVWSKMAARSSNTTSAHLQSNGKGFFPNIPRKSERFWTLKHALWQAMQCSNCPGLSHALHGMGTWIEGTGQLPRDSLDNCFQEKSKRMLGSKTNRGLSQLILLSW